MARETTLGGNVAFRGPTRNGVSARPAEALQHGMADLAHDVVALADLQGRLFAHDARETGRRAVLPTALAVTGGTLFLGTIPIVLFGFAYLLIEVAGLPAWASFFLTALGALIVTGILLAVAWSSYKKSTWPIKRSQDELVRNVRWVMDVLKRKGSGGAACP
jgi:hypothetical protein